MGKAFSIFLFWDNKAWVLIKFVGLPSVSIWSFILLQFWSKCTNYSSESIECLEQIARQVGTWNFIFLSPFSYPLLTLHKKLVPFLTMIYIFYSMHTYSIIKLSILFPFNNVLESITKILSYSGFYNALHHWAIPPIWASNFSNKNLKPLLLSLIW